MDIEKLVHCLQCCSRVDARNTGCDDCGLEYCGSECQQLCGTAATALSTLQAENAKLLAELEKEAAARKKQADILCELRGQKYEQISVIDRLLAELEQLKRALAMMWFAYVNSDKESPHSYETKAVKEAERLLGSWNDCMLKYLNHQEKEK